MGSLWGHFGITLGSLLDHFGVTLGSPWGHFGITLGSLWGHCGVTLGSLWGDFGTTLGLFWDHFGAGWPARLAGLAAFAGVAGLGENPVSGLESEPYYCISLSGLDPDYLRLRSRVFYSCLLYTSPSPRDGLLSRMPSSA